MARRKTYDPEIAFLDALDGSRPEYLECRDMSHDWHRGPFILVDTDTDDRNPRGGHRQFAERKLTCQRCGMVRSDAYAITRTLSGHTSLHKISVAYDPPEGYYLKDVGPTRGMRDILLGHMFDVSMATTRDTNRKTRKAS